MARMCELKTSKFCPWTNLSVIQETLSNSLLFLLRQNKTISSHFSLEVLVEKVWVSLPLLLSQTKLAAIWGLYP